MFSEKEKPSEEATPESRVDKNFWYTIKKTIERFNEEHIIGVPHVEFSDDQDIVRWEDDNYDINPENGLYNSFKQKDGTKVEIERTTGEEDLAILKDAIFSDASGKELLRLSSVLPEGCVILEEAKPNHDFMLACDPAVIVMAPNFLCSIEGRMRFLHEAGHIFDYKENQRPRSELLENLKGFAFRKREKNAWKKAKDVLGTMRSSGVKFLPEGFEETIMWKDFEEDCIEEHDYREGE